ncbi:MAG: AMP-binding protein [Acidimicrobiales bacterium]
MAIRSFEDGPGSAGASVAELIWYRSATSSQHVYLRSSDGLESVTYGELCQVAACWVDRLDRLGVRPGETVGLVLSDPVELAVLFLSTLAGGRTVAPLDPAATDGELVAGCGRTATRLVISDRAAPSGGGAEWLTVSPGESLLGREGSESHPAPPSGTGAAGGLVLSTSGTTGVPKVIGLDEAQLLHTGRSVADHFQLSGSDRGFNPLPLFHINAEVVGLLATLVSGATLVLDDRFHRHGFWAVMARHRITWINAVPAILARLAGVETGERVPLGIRFARSASAPLPVPVLERFEQATGIPVVETYGMTEAASQITANPFSDCRRPGSVGLPVGTEVRVVSADGAGAHTGEVGRVGVRGPSVIRAYRSPGYEDRVDPEGWLETGDLGYMDAEGYLFLVGRADDVINRGGEKFYPREVEDAVVGVPGVSSVAIVGREHEVLGQVPVAYLVVDGVHEEGDGPLAAAVVERVHDRCAQSLSRPKRPVAYHVVEQFPQGATGKVRRSALADTPAIFSMLVQ